MSHSVACYEVRPATIALSEDGNGFLSDLHWTTWTDTEAIATGLRYQRCWGYYPPGHQDPHCPGGTQVREGYNVPVKVFLSKPAPTTDGPLFSLLTEPGQASHWCVDPAGVACNVPPPTTALPAPNLAGAWWYVGHSAGGRAVDVVRLDLIDFPAGSLHGTWTEGAAPGYDSFGLNATECLGCGWYSRCRFELLFSERDRDSQLFHHSAQQQ